MTLLLRSDSNIFLHVTPALFHQASSFGGSRDGRPENIPFGNSHHVCTNDIFQIKNRHKKNI